MILTVKHHDGFCLWPSAYTDYSVKNADVGTDIVRQFADSARSRGMKIGFYYSIRDLTNGIDLNFVEGQLTELLTNYGDICCLFFDGWGWDAGYNRVPYDTIRDLVKSNQPNCLIIENNHEFNTTHSEVIEYEIPIDGMPKNAPAAEGGEPIRTNDDPVKGRCWFWHPNGECSLLSAAQIVNNLNACNSANANYLLSVAPDTSGLLPQCVTDRLQETGALK